MIFIIKMKTLVGPCGGDGMEGEGCRRNSQANINNNNNNNSKANHFHQTITIFTRIQIVISSVGDDDIKQ